MFLYHLNSSYINQSIVSHADDSLIIGSCLTDEQDNFYLVLGEAIHRPHLYNITQAPAALVQIMITTNKNNHLITPDTLSLIHQLAYEYYTSYTNIINLYLPQDLPKLLQKQARSIHKPQYTPIIRDTTTTLVMSETSQSGQQCIIMPDRRAITNYRHTRNYDLKNCLGSQHTVLQDIKRFWNIKAGLTSQLVCTPACCFWDYKDLKQIVVIDPHKRYYKSQQDPRYDLMRVAELMAHTYGCELITNM